MDGEIDSLRFAREKKLSSLSFFLSLSLSLSHTLTIILPSSQRIHISTISFSLTFKRNNNPLGNLYNTLFYKNGPIPASFSFFRLFNTVDNEYMNKILLLTVFEQWTSGVGSNHSTNWATTTAQSNALKISLKTNSLSHYHPPYLSCRTYTLEIIIHYDVVMLDKQTQGCGFESRPRRWEQERPKADKRSKHRNRVTFLLKLFCDCGFESLPKFQNSPNRGTTTSCRLTSFRLTSFRPTYFRPINKADIF